jgi:hypothetical protein
MGIFSRLRSRKSEGQPERAHSLIKYRYEDPKLEQVERDAAADVTQVEEDADRPPRAHSLIKYRYEDPKLEQAERDAAADIAQVEEDAKYFGGDPPQ